MQLSHNNLWTACATEGCKRPLSSLWERPAYIYVERFQSALTTLGLLVKDGPWVCHGRCLNPFLQAVRVSFTGPEEA